MGTPQIPARASDEVNELLLELGLQFIGFADDGNGNRLVRLRLVDRENTAQKDLGLIGERAISLLSTAEPGAVQALWQGARGVIIE